MKRNLLLILAPALLLVFAYNASTNTSGPGGGYSGAPGENTCNTSGCHNGTLRTSGLKWSKIRFVGAFSGNGYIPDSTYTITITYRESGRARYGFQITCLTAANDPAGTFTATNTRVQRATTSVAGKTREYIQHTSTGSSPVVSDSVSWSFSWKAPASNLGTLKFYVSLNAANNNGQSSGDSIYTKSFTLAPSTLLPVADATADVASSCTGYKVQFRGSGTNSPSVYSWTFATGTPNNSSSQNPSVTYTSAGTKLGILSVRNSKGWSRPDTVRISVLSSPSAVIGGPNSVNICPGDSLRLTANTVAGATYFWPSLNRSAVSVFVKDSGSYVVRVTANNACTATSQPVKVIWHPVSQAALSLSADSLCSSDVLSLTASDVLADSFLFYRNGKLLAVQKSNSFNDVRPLNNAIYTVRSKSANACLGPLSTAKSVFVQERLSPPAPALSVQQSDRLGFVWNRQGTALGIEVSADSGKTWKAADTDSSHLFTGLQAASDYRFFFRSINPAPCGPTDTAVVASTPGCGGRVITVQHADSVCLGAETQVVIRGLAGARYSTSLGGTFSKDTIYTLKPTATGLVRLVVKDSFDLACPDFQRSFTIRVDVPPALTVNYDRNPEALCAGDTLRYTVSSGFASYLTRINGNILGTETKTSLELLPSAAKTGDSLMVSGRLGACLVQAPAVKLVYRALPNPRFVANGVVAFQFIPADTTLAKYSWDFGDGNTSSAKKPNHTYGAAWYNSTVRAELRVADSIGCTSNDTLRIYVAGPDGVLEASAAGIRVYPIPAGKELLVQSERHALLGASLNNMQGSVVRSWNQKTALLRMPLEGLKPGNYVLLIRTEAGNFYRSVVIAE
ncbi:MAG: hypothetical protein RL160_2111 [Bacteroidota bacterium]|jgi:PKD repeat protein